jgi:hypothetical protein
MEQKKEVPTYNCKTFFSWIIIFIFVCFRILTSLLQSWNRFFAPASLYNITTKSCPYLKIGKTGDV